MEHNTLTLTAKKATNNTIWIYRWCWLNLVASCFFLFLFLLMVAIYILTPPVVVAVDSEGRLQETIEYLSADNRSDQEIIIAVKHFLSAKMSLNRDTIYTDMSTSLSMMSHELMEKELDILKKQEAIERIQTSNQRSYLEFTESKIIHRKNISFIADISGDLVLSKSKFPFRVQVEGTIVPRSYVNTFGIKIVNYADVSN